MVKTIRNTTHAPIRVPLPRGKVLHLGVGQQGQISHNDTDHAPLQAMIDEGVVEILDEPTATSGDHEQGKGPQADTHGHHPPVGSPVRGDR